jgi:hypothetical protein
MSIISNKLAGEGRLQFILACPCKRKHLSQGHIEAYIQGRG